MSTVRTAIALSVAALTAAACARPQTQTSTAASGEVAPESDKWVAVFRPTTKYTSSGITGNAHLRPSAVSGQSDIVVVLKGAEEGQAYPWEIVHGPCTKFDPAERPVSELAPLTVDAQGSGRGSAALDPATLDRGRYSIVVFSPLEHGEPIACGDLEPGS